MKTKRTKEARSELETVTNKIEIKKEAQRQLLFSLNIYRVLKNLKSSPDCLSIYRDNKEGQWLDQQLLTAFKALTNQFL